MSHNHTTLRHGIQFGRFRETSSAVLLTAELVSRRSSNCVVGEVLLLSGPSYLIVITDEDTHGVMDQVIGGIEG